ncbi:hypothetical protein [Ruminococcus albus]|uniref:N-acetyltransferase domain-containing protein n=1 Tax=Ruminococcus albus (strain ATCC 27210 / DSM 20455 / JCM 14654 / NCDO 2250 / 7) TaxID=697329 RepID=E6UBW7_RUMA7|nr:hypothetical protein [Ruminococcus albus]ADU21518.1 hypothetical protein Rumal_0992 [Ruminococcus albus 7 = DSM 20455]
MIYQTKDIDLALINRLRDNNYSRRIKSHFLAYGTKYDFLRFFFMEYKGERLGMFSEFNSALMVSTFEGKELPEEMLEELSGFVRMLKPFSVELERQYGEKLAVLLDDEYRSEKRTEFTYSPTGKLPQLEVDELPKLDDVYKILAQCFPRLEDSYEMWLTDTSHRIRRGLSQSFLMGDYTTATIQYIIDKIALVGQVGTIPEERGKMHARTLLYWIGERLWQQGIAVKLFARPHRVSYYEEIGFKAMGIDTVLERRDEKPSH